MVIENKSSFNLKKTGLISDVKIEELSDSKQWVTKTGDAVAYIKSQQQVLQFATEENKKMLWEKIKSTFTGELKDRRIDDGNELKNLQIKLMNEQANDYIARVRGISTICQAL